MGLVIDNDFDSVDLREDENGNDDDDVNAIPQKISISDIATTLIRDNFLLTALELHSELTERGRDLNVLRDYFSNPVHFEQPLPHLSEPSFQPQQQQPQLSRSNSVQTFESLEFSRYSDDGDKVKDEKIAVLEFELRKAKETIKNLRSQITNDATLPPVAPETGVARSHSPASAAATKGGVADGGDISSNFLSPMKEHEKRAINFLVNEYLLLSNCKLTAITLADENDGNQDLDDWDDVSLNVPRPQPLVAIYREHMHGGCGGGSDVAASVKPESVDAETLTTLEGDKIESTFTQVDVLEKDLANMRQESSRRDEEISELKTQNKRLNKEIAALMKEGDGGRSRSVSSIVPSPGEAESGVSGEENDNSVIVTTGEDEVDRSPVGKYPQFQTIFRRSLHNSVYSHLNPEGGFAPSEEASDSVLLPSEAGNIDALLRLLTTTLSNVVPNILLAKRGDVVPLLIATIVALQESPTVSPEEARESRDQLLNTLFNLVKKPDEEQRRFILGGCFEYAKLVGPVCVEVEFLPQCWEQIGHKYDERRLLVAETVGLLAAYVSPSTVTSLLLSISQNLLTDRNLSVRAAALKSLALAWTYVESSEKHSIGMNALLDSVVGASAVEVRRVAYDFFLPSFTLWTLNIEGQFRSLLTDLVDKIKQRCAELPPPPASRSVVLESEKSAVSVSSEISASIKSSRTAEFVAKTETEIARFFQLLGRLAPFMLLHAIEDLPDENQDASERSLSLSEGHHSMITSSTYLYELTSIFGSGSSSHLIVQQKISQFRALKEYDADAMPNTRWIIRFLQDLVWITRSSHPSRVRALSSITNFFHRVSGVFGENFARLNLLSGWQAPRDEDDDSLPIPQDLESSTLPVFIVGVFSSFSNASTNFDSNTSSSASATSRLSSLLHRVLIQASTKAKNLDALVATFVLSYAIPSTRSIVVGILRETVVHVSHVVRMATAALLKALVPSFNDEVISAQILPALITLASDSDVRVRIAAIPAFGAILDNSQADIPSLSSSSSLLDEGECDDDSTDKPNGVARRRDIVERVLLQFQAFLSDPVFRDNLPLQVQVLKTFAAISPNVDAPVREDFLLPRLAALAAENNSLSLSTRTPCDGIGDRKTEMALALLESYSAISRCIIPSQLIGETMLPGLRCLRDDMREVAPQYEETVVGMISELESKAWPNGRPRGSVSSASFASSSASSTSEDVKAKILKGWQEGSKFLSGRKK